MAELEGRMVAKRIALFDKDSIDEIEWPQSEESLHAQKLPLSLLKEGVKRYIPNIDTKFCFIQIDEYILPLTINDKEYKNAYLTSNYYAIKQMRERIPKAFHPFVALFGALLKCFKINKTVIINNWLLSNSLYPNLSDEQLNRLTSYLKKRFPYHLLMFRGINEADGKTLLSQLKGLHYHTLFSRVVFYFNPKEKPGKRTAYHRRRDERLMQSKGYTLSESIDYTHLIWLYKRVYRDKHTVYAPNYTSEYLKNAVDTGFLTLRVLKCEGKEVGVFGYTVKNGVMIVPFFGYDIDDPNMTDVYRLLIMLIIKEAESLGVSLNDGSGGGKAKMFRGMKAFDEYVAVYARHLPPPRKLFWRLAGTFSKSF